MASNSFKASQLIAHLRVLMEHHGDVDVAVVDRIADRVLPLTEKDVVASTGLPGKPLPGVVFAIGPRDPVEDYVFTADGPAGAFNTDLAAAPTGDELEVNKRFGGVDRGFKDAAGVWHCYEGGARAWPLAPGGVLGWRRP